MISAMVLLIGLIGMPAHSQELAQRLGSQDTLTRMKAVSELEAKVGSDSLLLADQEIQQAVVTLLEDENAHIAEHWAAFLKSGEDRLSERYAEYYAQLLGLANRIRNEHMPPTTALAARLRRALVFGTYNPDSAFAKDLAREGERIVTLVLELTRMPDGPNKWNGYGLIGELFAHQQAGSLAAPLSAASAESLRASARAGLLDPAADVKIWAISAVVKGRDKRAIPLLERLAQSGPGTEKGPAQVSVRSAAAEALVRLR